MIKLWHQIKMNFYLEKSQPVCALVASSMPSIVHIEYTPMSSILCLPSAISTTCGMIFYVPVKREGLRLSLCTSLNMVFDKNEFDSICYLCVFINFFLVFFTIAIRILVIWTSKHSQMFIRKHKLWVCVRWVYSKLNE